MCPLQFGTVVVKKCFNNLGELTDCIVFFFYYSSLSSVGQQSNEHVWYGPHAERRLVWLLQSGLHVLRQLLLSLLAKGLLLRQKCLTMDRT